MSMSECTGVQDKCTSTMGYGGKYKYENGRLRTASVLRGGGSLKILAKNNEG
jgi:hypothetical protein